MVLLDDILGLINTAWSMLPPDGKFIMGLIFILTIISLLDASLSVFDAATNLTNVISDKPYISIKNSFTFNPMNIPKSEYCNKTEEPLCINKDTDCFKKSVVNIFYDKMNSVGGADYCRLVPHIVGNNNDTKFYFSLEGETLNLIVNPSPFVMLFNGIEIQRLYLMGIVNNNNKTKNDIKDLYCRNYADEILEGDNYQTINCGELNLSIKYSLEQINNNPQKYLSCSEEKKTEIIKYKNECVGSTGIYVFDKTLWGALLVVLFVLKLAWNNRDNVVMLGNMLKR